MNTHLYGEKAGAVLYPLRIFGEDADYLTDVSPVVGGGDCFDNEMSHFADCAREGRESISPAKDGVAIQKILCGIYESAKTGGTVLL